MKLLLLVILFIIFFPIFKMWMLMRRARRNMEDAFEQVRRRSGSATGQSRDRQPYGADVGEYADYEDVVGYTADDEPSGPVTIEEQVIDAEFEDIR